MANEASTVDGSRVVYRSRIRVEPRPGKLKLVTLPLELEPVRMGFHDELASHAGLQEGAYPPTASTLDYLVAATAGCMTGVLSGALIARGIPTDEGRLRVEAVGDVEDEDGILVLRRIHVVAHLVADESQREAAGRAAATFHDRCPLYRSIGAAVAITSELDFRPLAAP
jgi:uncharacterized OsmC-like protein